MPNAREGGPDYALNDTLTALVTLQRELDKTPETPNKQNVKDLISAAYRLLAKDHNELTLAQSGEDSDGLARKFLQDAAQRMGLEVKQKE